MQGSAVKADLGIWQCGSEETCRIAFESPGRIRGDPSTNPKVTKKMKGQYHASGRRSPINR